MILNFGFYGNGESRSAIGPRAGLFSKFSEGGETAFANMQL
jgi:hypothetical protein